MSFLRQIVLGGLVLAGTLWLWVAYVPSATGLLDRVGVLDAFGIEPVQAKDEEGGGRRFGGGGATQVITAAVASHRLDDEVTAIGDGRALHSVSVRPQATGQIVELGIRAGRHVEAGDVIARLEDEAEQIAVERAKIVLSNAEDEYDRLSQLEGTGAVTSVRLREAELALRTAELELRQAQHDLDQRTVRAPISGWIGLLDVEVGDRVTTQDVLATLTDRSQILIDFRVPERVVDRLERGMEISVTPLATRDRDLTGEIAAIDSTVDRASRTLRVQGRLPNADDSLRAGMAFEVRMTFPGETLPAVDPLALQWSADGSYVWAVRDGQAARVPVTIRQRNADLVLVEAELEPGEPIVTEGVQTLRPGAEVSIAEGPDGQAMRATPAAAKL